MNRQVVSGRKRRGLMVVAFSLAAISAVYATTTALATPSTGLTTTILTKSLFDEIDINAHTIPASHLAGKAQDEGTVGRVRRRQQDRARWNHRLALAPGAEPDPRRRGNRDELRRG